MIALCNAEMCKTQINELTCQWWAVYQPRPLYRLTYPSPAYVGIFVMQWVLVMSVPE